MSGETKRSAAKRGAGSAAAKSAGKPASARKTDARKTDARKTEARKGAPRKTSQRKTSQRKTDAAGGPRTGIAVWLSGPLMSFHLVLTVTALLALSGLAMVLSASSVASYAEDGSAYSMFNSQLMYSVIGAIFFYLAMRVPIAWVRRFSPAAIGISLVLLMLVLVPGIGTEVQGARRWIDLGPFGLQPSELMKLALAVWGDRSRKR